MTTNEEESFRVFFLLILELHLGTHLSAKLHLVRCGCAGHQATEDQKSSLCVNGLPK